MKQKTLVAVVLSYVLILSQAAHALGIDEYRGPYQSGTDKGYRPRPIEYPRVPELPGNLEKVTGPVYSAGHLSRIIEQAPRGQTIYLEEGVYEGPVVIDTPVILEGRGKAVIDARGGGTAITIRHPGVVLSGLTVRGSGIGPVGSPMGIRVEADRTTVRNSHIYDVYIGIGAFGVSDLTVVESTVTGRGKGAILDEGHATGTDADSESHLGERVQRGDAISLWDSRAVLIRGNRLANARDGIYTSFGSEMLFDSNLVENSRYAIHTMFTRDVTLAENGFRSNLSGAILMYGGQFLLLRNAIERNRSPSTGFGVLIRDVNAVEINSNVVAENRIGLSLEGQSDPPTKLFLNTVALNQIGIVLQPSAQGIFSANSFVDNTTQVVGLGTEVAGKNLWYDRGIGNYWSNYKGYDRMGDGLGDLEHPEGGSVAELIAKNPLLESFASSVAFKMLGAVEDRWASKQPIALDPKPMMEPRSPRIEVEANPLARLTARGLAVLVILTSATIVLRMRVPHRRRKKMALSSTSSSQRGSAD